MKTKDLEQTEVKEVLEGVSELILHNDDYNTFEHVIDCLISICKHEATQAEQCAYIVHYNGKCTIKRGATSKLEPLLHALKFQNLIVELKK